jgi:hypothetical protein
MAWPSGGARPAHVGKNPPHDSKALSQSQRGGQAASRAARQVRQSRGRRRAGAAARRSSGCIRSGPRAARELQRRAADYARIRPGISEDDVFYAQQNAHVVKNAEAYYRSMFLEDVSSWNLRDSHMVETLELLVAHLNRRSHSPCSAPRVRRQTDAADMTRRIELSPTNQGITAAWGARKRTGTRHRTTSPGCLANWTQDIQRIGSSISTSFA